MDYTNFTADYVDIHHIFPQKYCERQGYDRRKWNCVVNKTPIAYRTKRKLGGEAPRKYLQLIEDTNVSADALDENLRSHVIDVASLRADDFQAFFICRAKALLKLIGKAMGKQIADPDSTDVCRDAGGVQPVLEQRPRRGQRSAPIRASLPETGLRVPYPRGNRLWRQYG